MYLDRKIHWQFLEDELKAETEEFNKKFLTTAISLLQQSEEMFVALFISFKDGEMIMKFPNTRALPRKGEFLVCMVLPPNLQNYRNWGEQTYRDLFKQRYNSSECVCIWHSPTNDRNYSLVGFSKVSLDFAEYIKNTPGIILTFAPQRPPIDYVMNLQRVVEDKFSPCVSSVLDCSYQQKSWEPILIKHDNVADFIYAQLNLCNTMILQGPPGTGKTFMIAELCARLCSEGYSVLVTALTNRALMEIAEKPAVQNLLDQKRIFKTNITTDEHKETPKLEPIKQISIIPSSLVLSTYYITSGFAADLSMEQPFDYVIMDEASQALLSMFAACKKMGKKNLWVGDIQQLSPIVSLNGDRIKSCGYQNLINGLQLLADNSSSPIYQLTTTYRFGQRSADYTGIFYNNSLTAKSSPSFTDIPSLDKILSEKGGPTLVLTDMPSGDTSPQFAIMLVAYIVGCILNDNKTKEVSVLTCMRNTTRALQKTILQNIGSHSNVLIDTVARIQGLTTDITVFFVPNTSYIRTLEPHLFNVATSRAKEHTIIIADKNFLEYPTIKPMVRKYLARLKEDMSIYVPDPEHGLGKNYNTLPKDSFDKLINK
jgi:hypothetical protein